MASGKCIYLEQKVLDYVLGRTAWTPPADVYVALSRAVFSHATTGASILANEPVGVGGYLRLHISNDTTNWAAADSTGQKVTLLDNPFPAITASLGTIRSFYILDGNAYSGADNCMFGSDISATVMSVGPGPIFAAGNLIVKES